MSTDAPDATNENEAEPTPGSDNDGAEAGYTPPAAPDTASGSGSASRSGAGSASDDPVTD